MAKCQAKSVVGVGEAGECHSNEHPIQWRDGDEMSDFPETRLEIARRYVGGVAERLARQAAR